MKELEEILRELTRLSPNEKSILATVVDVRGSSYRLPGARMLISKAGKTFGTVSGGCLEADVLERARRVLQTGKPTVLTYDTTAQEDSVFSLNMGCNGIVRILLEPANDNDFFAFVEKCIQDEKRRVVATLITSSNENKLRIGSRFFFDESGISLENSATEIERKLIGNARDVFASGNSTCRTFEIENEEAEFFLEIISPPTHLVIFGAGHDAIPVAEFAKSLGWRVSVVDHRAAFANRRRFPAADEILILRPEDLTEKLVVDEKSAAVIMTHNYAHDREILKFTLSKSLAYVGALGPKHRTENLLRELQTTGENFTANQLNKLFAPVGLDIGADTPESIALSIIAEIKGVLENRAGGFLRERKGSIYNRKTDDAVAKTV